MTLNYFFIRRLSLPLLAGMIAFVEETEPLLERGQGQGKVIWPDESMSAVQCLLR